MDGESCCLSVVVKTIPRGGEPRDNEMRRRGDEEDFVLDVEGRGSLLEIYLGTRPVSTLTRVISLAGKLPKAFPAFTENKIVKCVLPIVRR
jgi:hypothetical protein